MKKHQFLYNVIKTNLLDIKNFMQGNKEIEDLYNEINGYINYDMILKCYESKKNQKIFSNNIYGEVLELINKIVLYYNENCNCFIEENTDEINNLVKKSKDEFITTFNKIKKPILAVKENEKISILCLNYHRDTYFNKTNMKLTGFSQNSPSLYEFLADFFSISAVISTCFKLQEQYYKNIKVKHQSNKAESESKIAKFKQKIEEKKEKKEKSKSKKKKKQEDMSFISDLKDKNEDNFINNQKTTLINFDFMKINKI